MTTRIRFPISPDKLEFELGESTKLKVNLTEGIITLEKENLAIGLTLETLDTIGQIADYVNEVRSQGQIPVTTPEYIPPQLAPPKVVSPPPSDGPYTPEASRERQQEEASVAVGSNLESLDALIRTFYVVGHEGLYLGTKHKSLLEADITEARLFNKLQDAVVHAQTTGGTVYEFQKVGKYRIAYRDPSGNIALHAGPGRAPTYHMNQAYLLTGRETAERHMNMLPRIPGFKPFLLPVTSTGASQ